MPKKHGMYIIMAVIIVPLLLFLSISVLRPYDKATAISSHSATAVTKTIPIIKVGSEPRSIAVNPTTGMVYVANFL
jgi:DNA-binding beta-propeller fold protein YncE